MADAGAEQPGSTGRRYEEVTRRLGRSTEDQEDLWLLLLREYRLTIDQWEALPWWQQQAYLAAHNRHVAKLDAEREDLEQQPAGEQSAPPRERGRVAGRRTTPRDTAPAGSGGTRLKDTALWARRHTAPAAPSAGVIRRPRPGTSLRPPPA